MKYLEIRELRIQQVLSDRTKRVSLVRVGTKDNVSDLLTKGVSAAVLEALVPKAGLVEESTVAGVVANQVRYNTRGSWQRAALTISRASYLSWPSRSGLV